MNSGAQWDVVVSSLMLLCAKLTGGLEECGMVLTLDKANSGRTFKPTTRAHGIDTVDT
jgi:hypothetical protein